jgi:hypothetical protein
LFNTVFQDIGFKCECNPSLGEKLKKKFGTVSAPTSKKTERMFRESKLGKNEDPEIWIQSKIGSYGLKYD